MVFIVTTVRLVSPSWNYVCGERRGVRGPLTRDNSDTDREGWRAEDQHQIKVAT